MCNGTHHAEDVLSPARSEILSHSIVERFYASRNSISIMTGQERSSENHSKWLQDMFLHWPATPVQEESPLEADLKVLTGSRRKKRIRPLEISEQQLRHEEDFPCRAGPGEWHRGKGFVFDPEFEKRLRGVSSRKDQGP